MDNQEKLDIAVKLAQSYILLFLQEYIDSEKLANIKKLFVNCPVVVEDIDTGVNLFENKIHYGGYAQKDKIVINSNDITYINLQNDRDLNSFLGTIIHEYAHRIRALNNQYGIMLEEAFASIFAEVCINNARLKFAKTSENNSEVYEMNNSIKYQKSESQARAILYILKQKDLDLKMISEYIAGDEEKFKQVCIQNFGEEFIIYFNSISSRKNESSEELLINLITGYIKKQGLNISDYWQGTNSLTADHLYFKGSPTLAKAVVKAGVKSFKEEEQKYFRYYYSATMANQENDNLINQEKVDRIKRFIETNFSLKGKSQEEIYDTLIDLCSAYTQYKNRDDDESKIFIREINKFLPDIASFRDKFVELRVLGLDKSIFDNLDLNNVTYDVIVFRMNNILQIEKKVDKLGGIKK